MNWYQKSLKPKKDESSAVISTPLSGETSVSPQQIYTKNDAIQEREDLAPSMLRKRLKRKISL